LSEQAARLKMSITDLSRLGDEAACQAIRLGPDRPETTLLLSSKGWQDGRTARALCEANAATDYLNPRAWENLGYVLYASLEDKTLAKKAFERSLNIRPSNGDVWFRLSLCLEPDDWATRERCRTNLKQLGRHGDAAILNHAVPWGAWFRHLFKG